MGSHVPSPSLTLPGTSSVRSDEIPQGTAGEWSSIETNPCSADQLLTADTALHLAADLYQQAMACGGRSAEGVVGLSLGEMFLESARRIIVVLGQTDDNRVALLQKAGEVFTSVYKLRGSDEEDPDDMKATAWYNIACIAGLLGKAEHAAQALKQCLKLVPAKSRLKWLTEASEDADFRSVRNHPDLEAVLRGQ